MTPLSMAIFGLLQENIQFHEKRLNERFIGFRFVCCRETQIFIFNNKKTQAPGQCHQ